jgi:hypothetical protein
MIMTSTTRQTTAKIWKMKYECPFLCAMKLCARVNTPVLCLVLATSEVAGLAGQAEFSMD